MQKHISKRHEHDMSRVLELSFSATLRACGMSSSELPTSLCSKLLLEFGKMLHFAETVFKLLKAVRFLFLIFFDSNAMLPLVLASVSRCQCVAC